MEKQQDTSAVSPDERQRTIAETAYFIAEQHGFNGRDPLDDWLEAEAEVARFYRQKQDQGDQSGQTNQSNGLD